MTHSEAASRIKNSYLAKGVQPPAPYQIVKGFLRTSTSLVNGNSRTEFIISGKKDALPYEQLISTSDAFAITSMGVKLVREIVAAPGKAPLCTYPNLIQFPNTSDLVAADLEQVYNGVLKISVAQSELIPAFPTTLSRVVRTAQQSAAGNFSEQLPEDGMAEIEPMLILDGADKNGIALVRPTSPGEHVQQTDTTANNVKVVFEAHGWLILGGSRK